jgi:hypothetical protein
VTHETIAAALHNLQAQINEVKGLLKDTAKQPAKDETAGNIIKYSIRLAQLEGAFITLQEHAPALVQVANQYPLPPLPEPPPISEEDPEPLIITEGVSKTHDRVAKIHADTAAAKEKAEE